MAGDRVTELGYNERVNEVIKLILNGFSNRKVLFQHITETKDWNVSERMLDNYLKEAKAVLSTISENELEYEKNLALNRLDALYFMNQKIHDFRECRNIIETRSKILGYSAPVEIKHSGEIITQLPPIILQAPNTEQDDTENM
jgi:hypothetical protein